jgi:hypothetical protein
MGQFPHKPKKEYQYGQKDSFYKKFTKPLMLLMQKFEGQDANHKYEYLKEKIQRKTHRQLLHGSPNIHESSYKAILDLYQDWLVALC